MEFLAPATAQRHLHFDIDLEEIVQGPVDPRALGRRKVVPFEPRVPQDVHELGRRKPDDGVILLVGQDVDRSQHLALELVEAHLPPVLIPERDLDGENDISPVKAPRVFDHAIDEFIQRRIVMGLIHRL